MNSADAHCKIRLVVYTDDTLLAAGALGVFSASGKFDLVMADADVSGLIPIAEEVRPNIILLEMNPDLTLGFISAIRSKLPSARLVIWGRNFSDQLLCQARELGVAGVLRRGGPGDQLIQDLLRIAGGTSVFEAGAVAHSTRIALTPRESQLVALLVQGVRNKEIAACLGISEGTVRVYLSKLFVKIGARDRFEVAVMGLKNSFCGHANWDGKDAFMTEGDEDRARPVLRSLVLVEPKRRRNYQGLSMAAGA